ncbi:MAG TPA: HAD family phosphatase [Kiritimatiellia bacterium]|jgi:FMN phosphatase YigB (HAD superfamily)
MKQGPFENVFFDLGVVLLHLIYEPAVKELIAHCDPARHHTTQSFFSLLGRTHLVDDYERGDLTAAEYFAKFRDATGFRGGFESFAAIWRSIFEENTPMIDFARDLAKRHRVYILTNASDLHVPWVFERYPRLNFFTDYACSCYLRATKPSPEFYKRSLEKFGTPAGTCLFIDDRPENVEGAEACGIRSILYTTPEATIGAVIRALE